jgi:hypothetical protein
MGAPEVDADAAPSPDGPRRAAEHPVWRNPMIMLCERCFTPVEDDEAFVRFAHVDSADLLGNITCIYSYVHTTTCVLPRLAPHERPDTGEWDASRSIGVRRT